MTRTLALGAIGQIWRNVRVITETERWYGEVLGLKHLYSLKKIAFFYCGGVRLFLSESDTPTPVESIIYFNVSDIRAAHAQLTERGIDLLSAPHLVHRHPDGTEVWLAAFKDNAERPLAILSQVRPR